MHIFSSQFYSRNKGDLLRLGYIMDVFPDYRSIFSEEFKEVNNFSNISEIQETNCNTLIVGDSFSKQENIGYKDYLGEKAGVSLLYFDVLYNNNPLQVLYSLVNGDFFDKNNIEYVILQSVERSFVRRIENLDTTKVLSCEMMSELISKAKVDKEEHFKYKFPPSEVIKLPIYNLFYLLDDNAFLSPVYRTELDSSKIGSFFSVNESELLFFSDDLLAVADNNSKENVAVLNDILNDLSVVLRKKGIKLIVLPSPDKYDIYYDYILEKNKYPRPLFFEYLDKMEKEYLYINSKAILTDAVKRKKDIYFYDDTHWSPWASQMIAGEIYKLYKQF